jgi:hypothetical protein
MSVPETAEPGLHPQPKPEAVDQTVLRIQRMSVSFDALEDRIALDVDGVEGVVARLWLTRRGTDTIVSAAAAKVEAYAVSQYARANVPPAAADQLRQSALATRQLTARLTQRNAQGVIVSADTPEHIVTGFALTSNAQHIRLDFQCRPELSAMVLLQSAELFQWLAALQRQYQKAGWGMEVWPAWFTQKSKS